MHENIHDRCDARGNDVFVHVSRAVVTNLILVACLDRTIYTVFFYLFVSARPGYADEVPLMAKFLWRKGYLRMPTTCTEAEHGTGDDSTCRSSCPAEVCVRSANFDRYGPFFPF